MTSLYITLIFHTFRNDYSTVGDGPRNDCNLYGKKKRGSTWGLVVVPLFYSDFRIYFIFDFREKNTKRTFIHWEDQNKIGIEELIQTNC